MPISDLLFATDSERVKSVRFLSSSSSSSCPQLGPNKPQQQQQDYLLVSLYSGEGELYEAVCSGDENAANSTSNVTFSFLSRFRRPAASLSSSGNSSIPSRSSCFVVSSSSDGDKLDAIFASDDGHVFIYGDVKRRHVAAAAESSSGVEPTVVEIGSGSGRLRSIVRSVVAHPLQRGFFASTDDGTVAMYLYDEEFDTWKLEKSHNKHFLITMQLAVAPVDAQKILRVASASQDLTAVVWMPEKDIYKTLKDGHLGGLNCVAFHPNANNPLLLTGADDEQILLWNYQTESVLKSFNTFSGGITNVAFSLTHKLILGASEDGSIQAFKMNNFRPAFEFRSNCLSKDQYKKMGRVWSIDESCTGVLAVGYDNGMHIYAFDKCSIIYDFSRRNSNNKFVFCEQQNVNVLQFPTSSSVSPNWDSEYLNSIKIKKLGVSDNQDISDITISPDGKYIALHHSDHTFSCQSALAFRNQCLGKSSVRPVFSDVSDLLFTSFGESLIVYHNNFKSTSELEVHFQPECIFGGPIIAVTCSDDPMYRGTMFFTSESQPQLLATIQLKASKILWNRECNLLLAIGDDRSILAEYDSSKINSEDLKHSRPFKVLHKFNFKIKSAIFSHKYLLYINNQNNLEVMFRIESQESFETTVLLSYVQGDLLFTPDEQSLITVYFESDKRPSFKCYSMDFSLLAFKQSVLSGQIDEAKSIFSEIDMTKKEEAINFLEFTDNLQLAYDLTTNESRKASLAIKLGRFEDACELSLTPLQDEQLLSCCLKNDRLDLVQRLIEKADKPNLSIKLLFVLSQIEKGEEGGEEEMRKFIKLCEEQKQYNLLLIAAFYCKDQYKVLENLNLQELYAESVIFANSFCPQQTDSQLSLHHDNLVQRGHFSTAERLILDSTESRLIEEFE